MSRQARHDKDYKLYNLINHLMYYTSKEVYEYISRQNNPAEDRAGDPIVEWKICRISGQAFAVFQSDLDFYAKISPTFAGQKFPMPTPTLCPEERQRRRISFRNFFKLKKRICAATGATVISQSSEPYQVYSNDYRWSDKRDAIEYGQSRDETQSFFDQRKKLDVRVPKYATHTLNCENSDYCNMAGNSKDCYLIAGCVDNESCMYGHILRYSEDCLDTLYCKRCTHCYQCIDCLDCTSVRHGRACEQCDFSSHIVHCVACSHCIGCVCLHHQSYCIFNKQYSKEAYEQKKSSLTEQDIYTMIQVLLSQTIYPACKQVQCEHVYGNEDIESRNLTIAYDAIQSEDSKYLYTLARCQSCMDVSYTGFGAAWSYECLFPHGQQLFFCHNCHDGSTNLYYSENCYACSHCFGCIGLKNKSYCILNTQYTKESYELLVARIISAMQETGERGEFFHPSLSPFGYNQRIFRRSLLRVSEMVI